MPEVEQIKYSLIELTKLMLRDQGIRSGTWMILTKWSHVATNVRPPEDESVPGPAGPAMISVLVEAGIQRVEEPGPLSVNAAEVWGKEAVVEEEKRPERKKKRKGKKNTKAVRARGPISG